MASKESKTATLGVSCSPKIDDPSELNTIIITSLRALFGELEMHSHGMLVKRTESGSFSNRDDTGVHFVVQCQKESAHAIQAALTMPTLPLYFDSKLVYRFDTIELAEKK
jgi:RNase P/RNase MRP subunit POP5